MDSPTAAPALWKGGALRTRRISLRAAFFGIATTLLRVIRLYPPMNYEVRHGEFLISTDHSRLDLDGIHAFLSHTYWGHERPREVLEKAIRNCCCFGLYHASRQVGFARVITDYATYGYLADVYVLEAYRGRGLGRWLVQSALAHPELKFLRRWALVTKDAHSLYRQCGFSELQHPEEHMQRLRAYPKPGEILQTS